jgi:hypothetical protein
MPGSTVVTLHETTVFNAFVQNCGKILQVHNTTHAYDTPQKFTHSLQ